MSTENLHVVVGLGATGLSFVRFLQQRKIPVAVTDTRLNPPGLEALMQNYPEVKISLGKLDEELLSRAKAIVLSPGVALREPAIAKQVARGVPVLGDIELFAREVKNPLVVITGSNAKSTVTTLVGLMVEAAGLNARVGGNLGIPALELLDPVGQTAPTNTVYVLELSSFQLETTYTLAPQVATVLNVTPDHMDRYDNLEAYKQAKQRIYKNCEIAVCNRDDPSTECGNEFRLRKFYFTLDQPVQNEFGLIKKDNETYLAFENELLMPVRDLPVRGRHYQANALAALALGHSLKLPRAAMLKVLREFKGLAHRCQFLREHEGVAWYNDSKGTNVGATVAAMEGLGSEIKGKLILIAGGVGKSADFTPLLPAIKQYLRTAILIGEAAPELAKMIGTSCEVVLAADLAAAVQCAEQKAHPGDCVLLSPACASFDMFKNYEHRGEVFMQLVQELPVCTAK